MIAELLSHVLSGCPKLEPLTVQIHFVVIAFSGKVMMPKALCEIFFYLDYQCSILFGGKASNFPTEKVLSQRIIIKKF